MDQVLRRRTVLKLLFGLMGAPVLRGCSSLPGRLDPWTPPWGPVIDIHAHIFNATDIPAAGFVKRVYNEDFEEPYCSRGFRSFRALDDLLVRILTSFAPTAEAELAYLQNRSAATWPETSVERREFELTVLSDTLVAAYNENVLNEPGDRNLRHAPQRDAVSRRTLGLLRQLANEAGLGRGLDLEFRSADQEDRLRQFASEIHAADGPTIQVIKWALFLLRPRHQILRAYANLYGGRDRVALFTPALVDLDHWIQPGGTPSPLRSQIDLMDYLQRRSDRLGLPKMHGIVPFDPWRDIAKGGEALDLVRLAIEEKGFIGVKLYPPMGFSPGDQYPEDPMAVCFPPLAGQYPPFRRRIAKSLNRLYRYCDKAGVPIMAHANDSQQAGSGFGRRAHPRYWRPVMRKYKKLRVNLAHFGGFEEELKSPPDRAWEHAVIELHDNHAPGRVFADLGHMTEVLTSSRVRQALVAKFRRLLEASPQVEEILLFGTDWTMIGRFEEHELYLSRMDGFLTDAGFDVEAKRKLYRSNAIRFLGLQPGQANRSRLNDYRGSDNFGWLQRLLA